MTEVQDSAGDVELESYDRPVVDVAEGMTTVPGVTGAVAGLVSGGEGTPGFDDVAGAVGGTISDATGFIQTCNKSLEAGSAFAPLDWLVSNGLDFLLATFQPLQDALDMVTGDAESLNTASGNFVAIGEGIQEMSDNFIEVADEALAEWSGEASDAARKKLADFTDGITGVASHSVSVSEILEASAKIMDAVEAAVKSILTQLISWAIQIWVPALAAAGPSLGGSVASAWTATFARLAVKFPKTMKLVNGLMRIVSTIADFFGKVEGALKAIGGEVLGKALFKGGTTYLQEHTGIDYGALADGDVGGLVGGSTGHDGGADPDVSQDAPSAEESERKLDF